MAKEITRELIFLPEEAVVYRMDKVGYGTPISTKSNELILTDQALILVRKGLLGKTKEVVRYPLSDIRMVNGKPQVKLSNPEITVSALDVYLTYGEERFKFTWDKEVEEWIAQITEVITGEKAERKGEFDDLADMLKFAESVTGTVKEVRKAFGIKSDVEVVCRCTGCGEPLHGMEGDTVQCPYCRTWNQLKDQ